MHEAQTGALLTAVLLVPALLAPALPAPAPAGANPLPTTRAGRPGATFDHGYTAYGAILREHVIGDRIDYASLRRNRAALDSVVSDFEETPAAGLANWTDRERMAYWINAYNAFTLQAVTDHYPITRNLLSPAGWLAPADSIRQIAGFRTRQRWQPGGRPRSLDDILHEELRTGFDEPRIHFALCCAAAGCPPLRREPYTPVRLERQLILAARDHLSDAGLRVDTDGETLYVSSVLRRHGADFVDRYGHLVDAGRSPSERAVRGIVALYGPSDAVRMAGSAGTRIRDLDLDWSLNDASGR